MRGWINVQDVVAGCGCLCARWDAGTRLLGILEIAVGLTLTMIDGE
jgi:hypothetical protein